MSSFRKKLKVFRVNGKPTLGADGIFRDAPVVELHVMASVQPLKATEMQALPEGRRGARAVKVYSDTELYMAEQMTGQQADRFVWLGRMYEVIGCDAYQCEVISHYKSLAVEVTTH